MTDQLLQRVERLESQNRKMKLAMLALTLCLLALLTMGQTSSRKSETSKGRIEAREIVLVDGAARARLTPDGIVFSGPLEAEKTTVSASGISLTGRYAAEVTRTGLIFSREGMPRFDLSVGEIGAAVAFKNASGLTGTMADESTIVLMNNAGVLSLRPEHLFLQKGEAEAFLTPSSLKVRDSERFKAILGKADQTASKTGDTQARSAASVTLVGRDDAVLWQAP